MKLASYHIDFEGPFAFQSAYVCLFYISRKKGKKKIFTLFVICAAVRIVKSATDLRLKFAISFVYICMYEQSTYIKLTLRWRFRVKQQCFRKGVVRFCTRNAQVFDQLSKSITNLYSHSGLDTFFRIFVSKKLLFKTFINFLF